MIRAALIKPAAEREFSIQQMEKKNLALEALRKLLGDEIRSRSRANLTESWRFSERLEDAIAENENAVEVLGNNQLKVIALELLNRLKRNLTFALVHREKRPGEYAERILCRYGYFRPARRRRLKCPATGRGFVGNNKDPPR